MRVRKYCHACNTTTAHTAIITAAQMELGWQCKVCAKETGPRDEVSLPELQHGIERERQAVER
jgi:hypothetical protein